PPEDQLIFAPVFFQPSHHVPLLQALPIGQAVERQVAPRPVQISFRQIDTGRAARAALGSMYGGRRGIAEEIEKTLASRFTLNTQAQRPMIEEQPRVQIIGEVHQELDATLAHFEKLSLAGLTLILTRAALALAALDHYPVAGDAQRLGNRPQRIEQAFLGLLRVNGARWRVFLYVHPVSVQVDGQGIFRHVGVIQAVTLNAFPARPFAQLTQVLLQTIGEHLPAFAETCQLGLGLLISLACFLPCRCRALTGDELVQLDLDQQQLAGQGAVPEGVLLVTANAHALTQVGRRRQHRRFPAETGLAQALTKVLVQINQT